MDFPNLDGCRSFGDTIAETLSGAEEAHAPYLKNLQEGLEHYLGLSDPAP